jgi:hypothetical protein
MVLHFWRFLRWRGIDAHADVIAAEQRQDWTEWMTRQIDCAEWVLVIASPEYRRRAEGYARPDEGRGVQWEAALIRERLYADRQAGMRQVLPVVLPKCSADDIPMWLTPTAATYYQVTAYTLPGAEPLLRVLTRQPRQEPPIGRRPFLPPRAVVPRAYASTPRMPEPPAPEPPAPEPPAPEPPAPEPGAQEKVSAEALAAGTLLVEIPGRPPVSAGLAEARNRVLRAARHGGARFDVVADGGCGKTRLLEELAVSLRRMSYLPMSVTVSPPGHDMDSNDELDRMRGDESAYRQIIAWLANGIGKACIGDAGAPVLLDPDTGWNIQDQMLAARDAGSAPAESGGYSRLDDAGLLRRRWQASKAAFIAAMERLAGYCRVAVLVDDFHLILGTGAGKWLTDALGELPQVLVIYARRPDVTAAPPDRRAESLKLGPMTREQTIAFAVHELAGWDPKTAEEIGSSVFAKTGGYPVWVTTCCQVIAARERPGADPAEVLDRLLDTDDTVDLLLRFRDFVDDYAAGILGTRISVFGYLTILRRVNRGILTALLGERGIGRRDISSLFDWLGSSAFMTVEDDHSIRLHDLLRHQMDAELRRHDMTVYRELHEAAEGYYREQLDFEHERDTANSPYQYGSRYEEPEWQRDSLEWLHHIAWVSDTKFASVKSALVRLFFDAFWWWDTDSDTPSGYCDLLLSAYRALPLRSTGNEWIRLLEKFQHGYVTGVRNRIPGRDGDRWSQADAALSSLWHAFQLDTRQIPQDHDLRRIHILICMFRGDVAMFGSVQDADSRQLAADWYDAAHEAASKSDVDHWIANWAAFCGAELWVETDPARAARLTEGLEQQIREEGDHELPAYLAWLYGDLAWLADDKPAAFARYARAVLHAYVYHVWQERLPQNPTPFTVSLYQLFLDRFTSRLDQARRDGLTEVADAAVGRVRALFVPYWRHVHAAPGNANGLPPQPQQADLNRIDTQFADNLQWFIAHMRKELDAPLDSPLEV